MRPSYGNAFIFYFCTHCNMLMIIVPAPPGQGVRGASISEILTSTKFFYTRIRLFSSTCTDQISFRSLAKQPYTIYHKYHVTSIYISSPRGPPICLPVPQKGKKKKKNSKGNNLFKLHPIEVNFLKSSHPQA